MENQLKIQNDIIVVGGNHHNSLGIIRSLGESAYKVKIFYISFGLGRNFVAKSRYIKKWWQVKNEQEFLNVLFSEFLNKKLISIIIPTDDLSVSIVDRNISKIGNRFFVPNINNETNAINNYMNKVTMNKIAEMQDLKVPKTITIDFGKLTSDKELENKLKKLHYPCIVKPLKSIDGNKGDINISINTSELKENLKKLKKKYNKLIVQEFLEKEMEFGIQGLATKNSNKVFVAGIVKKIRQSKVSPGSTTYGKIIESHPLIDLKKIKSLIKKIGYVGIFDIELIYSKGTVYFIEVNFRNGAYGYAFTQAGVNIPIIWCLDAIGYDISNEPKMIKRSVTLISEFADLRNTLDRKIGIIKWLRQLFTSDVHLVFNFKDIKPFFYKIFYKIISKPSI